MELQSDMNKALVLMKNEGLSAERALSTVYPDMEEGQIKHAAMTIRMMDNTTALMKLAKSQSGMKGKLTFSPAMDDSPHLKGRQSKLPDQIQAKILKSKLKKSMEKKAMNFGLDAVLGGGLGYLRGSDVGKPGEGAVRGALGSVIGSGIGGLGSLGIGGLASMAKGPGMGKIRGLAGLGMIAAPIVGSIAGYQHMMKGLYKNSPEPVHSGGKTKKGGVTIDGLRAASNSLYASHLEKNAKLFGLPSVTKSTAAGGGIGALLGGGGELARLLNLGTDAGEKLTRAKMKELRAAERAVGPDGKVKRVLPFQTADASKGEIGFMNNAKADADFAKKLKKLREAGGFAQNKGAYLSLFAPKVLENALTGAAAGGIAGAGGGAFAKNRAIANMKRTAKAVAVPTAIGAGSYALLS